MSSSPMPVILTGLGEGGLEALEQRERVGAFWKITEKIVREIGKRTMLYFRG